MSQSITPWVDDFQPSTMTERLCVPSTAMSSLRSNRILSRSKFSIIRWFSPKLDGKPMIISCIIDEDADFRQVVHNFGGTHVRISAERKWPDLSYMYGSKCFTVNARTMTTECLRLKDCINAPIFNDDRKFSEILRRNHFSSRSSFLSSFF